VPLRALLVTFIAGLLAFAVSLLFGIIGTIVYARASGKAMSLVFAYRMIALPTAVAAAAVMLAISLTMEIRQYRQNKALASIENAG
jgi:ABC-type sulfate transport system permease component